MTILNRIGKYIFFLTLFVLLQTITAQEENSAVGGTGFLIQVDWLSNRFSSISLDPPKGLSLISPNAALFNRYILKINYLSKLTSKKQIDATGKNLIFDEEYEGLYSIPSRSVSLEQYYQLKAQYNLRTKLHDICSKELSGEKEAVRSEKLELIGADIAGQRVSLRVSGNVNINGRLQNQQQSQVRTGYQAGSSTTFIVDQKQQLNIEGKIGDKISILVDQDSERDFDFENNLKIIYTGEEDDIVQKIEAGNVALSLPGTQFVTFSGKNNGLFGLKALMKLGGLDITTIASVEKGKKEKLSVDGGAQQTVTTIRDYDYRKGQYFFVDNNFRSTFYDGFLENGGIFNFNPNRVIADLEVYQSIINEVAGSMYGYAYIDPNQTDQDTSLIEQRIFKRLDLGQDYIANPNLGFIRLAAPAQESDVIAVVYRIVDANGTTIEEYGDWRSPDTSNIILKLIKPQQSIPSHPCWDLEFKNIYSLGTTGINAEGFELSIVYMFGETGDEAIASDGINFLQKFGLDLKDQSGSPTPDDVVDLDNPAIINLQSGELWFPYLRPFQYIENDVSGEHNPNLSDLYSSSALYDSNRTQQSEITEDSKFKILCKYENRSSIINLGAMVIENSESVSLGNETLTRGVDYTIDYFSGTLTLLRQDALNPDAKLDIKYERNQFFQLDKKTILGARAQYDFGENSFIGGTALYFSQSVIDEKVDVGYEPMRNFVWDINGRLNKDLNFLTRAVNWLPLVETDQQSTISFEGEIAQVRPNPNTLDNEDTGDKNGVGFIDDFEGSKRITSPPIMQRYWAPSSVPLGKTNNERGFLFWYNPYGGVPTTNIWPNKEVSTQAQNNLTEIMVLTLDPDWSIAVADAVAPRKAAWGGITYPFPTSYYDQSKTKFLEIWVRGNSGQMHVDLGQISEDYIVNGKLDTEDKPEAGFTLGNDLLDDGEDTGIDGLFDEDEFIINSFGETIPFGDERLTQYKRSLTDPHSDNWKWSEGSSNYRDINGTEKSIKDASGYVPDSEDLNRNYVVDLKNDYFTVDFSLDDRIDDQFVAGRTKFKNGKNTGWKLYRIPLNDFQKAQNGGSVSWQTIEACRIWIDGVSGQDSVMLAKIEMVGNEWEELGIASENDGDYVLNDEAFAISVINSEDNPDTYFAPKGVQGEYDAINEIQLKEQSLVMWFDGSHGIHPGEKAAAKKVLFEEASYITYKKLKLFINGQNIHTRTKYYSEGEKTPLQFFIRFGRGGQNPQFYEYRGPIYPGWDKRNNIEIDLDFMTSLKSYISEQDFPDNDAVPKQYSIIYDDNGDILQRRWREVKNGEYTGVEIIIWGNPAISRIQQLEIGVLNQKYALNDFDESFPLPRYDNTVFGEVWLDELRLSGVRRNAGVAYRTKATLSVADLMKFDVGIDRKDADFHTVEQRPSLQPSGLNTSRNFSARGSVSLNKFTPASWGLQLPVSGSYTSKYSAPKFVPGTDILAGGSPADSILSLSESYGINTSYSKRVSDFWLTKYTIDQLRLSANAQWSNSSSVSYVKQETESYQGSISYKVPFGRDNFIQPFKWIRNVPIIGEKLGDFRWYYTPSSLDFSMDANETQSTNIPRNGEIKYPYDFGLNRSITGSYKMFDNLNLNYSQKIKTSLIDFRDNKLKAVQELNPGIPINIAESYTSTFSPKIFSWFSPSLSYSANYSWAEPVASSSKSIDQLSNQNRISTSFSLSLAEMLKSVYTPKSASSSSHRPGGSGSTATRSSSRSRNNSQDTKKEEASKEKTSEIVILEQLYKVLDRIQPVQISYSTSQSVRNLGRVGTPDLAYRMGFATDPELEIITEEASSFPDNISVNSDASVRSGVKITNNINTSFSFAQNMAWSESQGNKSHNITRDYLTFDNTGKKGIPFPGWTLNIASLEKIRFLSGIFKKLSLDHGFSGKEAIVYRNGEIQSASYKTYFQPLVGLSMQFKNNISSTLRMTMGKTITNLANGGANVVRDQNINASMNYQKKGGMTIPIPFLKKKRLDNTITFTMTFDYSSSVSEGKNSATEDFAVQQENRNWKVEPRISYSFTQKVTGGIFYSYGESFNARTGKRITRNGGFDVNIAIRG